MEVLSFVGESANALFGRFLPRTRRRVLFKFCPYVLSKLRTNGNARRGTACPKARSGHRIVADWGNIYSFGGYNPTLQVIDGEEVYEEVDILSEESLFKELWVYNIASQTWTQLDTTGLMPNEVASHGAVMLNQQLVVFGGTGIPFGTSSSNRVHICDLRKLEWNLLEVTGHPPEAQYGQAIALHNGGLYVVGGTTGFEYSMLVHRLDLATKEWSELHTNNMPDPRYRHEIAIDDGKLFVFGGGTADCCFGFEEIPVFDLKTCEWEIMETSETCPTPRRCHGCVQLESDVFISGGHDGNLVFSDVWKIHLKTMTWEKLKCSLPRPVYFHSVALSPLGQMFIFGGVTDMKNTRTNELYSMWVKLPPLVEMCWQSVVYYIPKISSLSKQQLLELGIPFKFLDRIDFSSS